MIQTRSETQASTVKLPEEHCTDKSVHSHLRPENQAVKV